MKVILVFWEGRSKNGYKVRMSIVNRKYMRLTNKNFSSNMA